MFRIAQVLSSIFVIIFTAASMSAIFFPETLGAASGFNPTSDYGLTNIRTLGAPLLMMAIVTAVGIYAKNWIYLVPASMYFLFNGSTRVISLFNEQYDDVMLRGLFLTFGLFVVSLWVLKQFRQVQNRPEQNHAAAV